MYFRFIICDLEEGSI